MCDYTEWLLSLEYLFCFQIPPVRHLSDMRGLPFCRREIAILELGWGQCSLLSRIKGQPSGKEGRQGSFGYGRM